MKARVSSSSSSSIAGLRRRSGARATAARGAEEEALPGMGADRVPEAGLVGSPLEPVAAAVLPVGPADGKLRRRLEVVVDDRSVPDGRPEDAVAARAERADQAVERVRCDHDSLCPAHARHGLEHM